MRWDGMLSMALIFILDHVFIEKFLAFTAVNILQLFID